MLTIQALCMTSLELCNCLLNRNLLIVKYISSILECKIIYHHHHHHEPAAAGNNNNNNNNTQYLRQIEIKVLLIE